MRSYYLENIEGFNRHIGDTSEEFSIRPVPVPPAQKPTKPYKDKKNGSRGRLRGLCVRVQPIYAGAMRISAVAVEMVRSYVLSAIGNQQQLQKHAHKQGDN